MNVTPLAAPFASERADRPVSPVASRPLDGATAAEAFEKAMPTGQGAGAELGEGPGQPAFHHQSSRSAELRPLQKFEAFVLRSFVESMLPSQNTSFFGTGTAGNIWRSMLAERIGDEMAKSGGIGIAEMLEERGRTAEAAATEPAKTT